MLFKKISLLIVVVFIIANRALAQETKDNSKPTNLYSQIDNFLEYTSVESLATHLGQTKK
jgi:hypothetical protein